jgi:MarR family
VTDFLSEKREEIDKRLAELKPLVDEYLRLEAAASALASVAGRASATATTAPRRPGPGRPRKSASTTVRAPAPAKAKRKTSRAAKRRTGRRKGNATRAAEALSLVTEQPGITISELARKMGIKQNYLYRVLPSLEQEGKLNRQGGGWYGSAGWDSNGP